MMHVEKKCMMNIRGRARDVVDLFVSYCLLNTMCGCRYQGSQNDFVLLSLVRTHTVGHIRDVRRLVVAVSRARLGLYVFCRKDIFSNCFELVRTFSMLNARPDKLQLEPGEVSIYSKFVVLVEVLTRLRKVIVSSLRDVCWRCSSLLFDTSRH